MRPLPRRPPIGPDARLRSGGAGALALGDAGRAAARAAEGKKSRSGSEGNEELALRISCMHPRRHLCNLAGEKKEKEASQRMRICRLVATIFCPCGRADRGWRRAAAFSVPAPLVDPSPGGNPLPGVRVRVRGA
jgi:hypothetical protein